MRLLIIGDLGGQLITASKIAVESGAKVLHVPTIESAMNVFRSGKTIDIIFIDIDHDIELLIKSFHKEHIHNIPVVACGIENDPEKAVKAIKAGAVEYLPIPPQADLIAAILETISKSNENLNIIAISSNIKDIMQIAAQVASSNATVLITGESGTGKEVIAKYIHNLSNRSKNDLIAINCAAIPENLLESELFGHEKGAFTGAIEKRIGKFEAANNSTIFLDEISEMDLRLQAKLLRVLQDKVIVRIGGNASINLDIRVIASSNRNLIDFIKEGKFREDLFYRLNVITIELPPLRNRKEDIPLLIEHFIIKYANLNNIEVKELSPPALEKILNYNWPGNIRELENCIHRALLLSKSNSIELNDIMLINQSNDNSSHDKTLKQVEYDVISSTLSRYGGDEVKTSMILGISIRALKTKLNQYKISNS